MKKDITVKELFGSYEKVLMCLTEYKEYCTPKEHEEYIESAKLRVKAKREVRSLIAEHEKNVKENPVIKIQVSGRRWFQKTYGNTYHAVTVWIERYNGDEGKLGIDFAYGYGDQYLQSAFSMLQKGGFLKDEKEYRSLWRYCEDKGIEYISDVRDVDRKKDLNGN